MFLRLVRMLRALMCWAAVLISLEAGAYAQLVRVTVDTEQSSVSYTGYHPVHAWTGTSRWVSGTLYIDADTPSRSRISLRVPVQSFGSGNEKRDAKMLDLVEAATYPEVTFVSTAVVVDAWMTAGETHRGTWHVRGLLTFHGQTHPLDVRIAIRIEDGRFEAEGSFEVSLKRYHVRRPRLMLVPIRDIIDLQVMICGTLPLTARLR